MGGIAVWLRRLRPPALPPHLVPMLHEHQRASEELIGWVQLGVVLTFATLYAIAPKTAPVGGIQPVPWVLAAWLAFTLARLAAARRGWLAAAWLSIVVDIGLLYGLIWSFHVQYGQPPAFYLKVPTLLYVFIFIALRALRFEARYVLACGVAAALGWLMMLGYAIGRDPQAITRDYVHYLTSNTVLLGGEFDKVITLLTVTAILALAIARARRLLLASVRESGTARELARFLPMAVASRVAASATRLELGQGELRAATMLFIDLEGFTALSERLAPERLIATLNDYFAAVTEPIERHGGTVDQFIGDAVMATFNLPEALPEHAACALRAALEIQALFERRTFGEGLRLRARIGINSGVVIGGLVGAGERLAYTVYGDAVNLAARLEPLNKDFGTSMLVSEDTRRHAGPERFAFRRVGEVRVRGRSEVTPIYTVDGETPSGAAP